MAKSDGSIAFWSAVDAARIGRAIPLHDPIPLVRAFEALGAALDVLVAPDPALRRVYERDLILVRPDMHVAWRSDRLPETANDLAALVTGRRGGTR